MPFDVLCKKVATEAFNPEAYKTTGGRKFFDFDKSAYDTSREEARLVKSRTVASDEPLVKIVNAEVRFGWVCGMDRDRIVQRSTNYSELLRNNCVLKKDVSSRLQEAYNGISEN